MAAGPERAEARPSRAVQSKGQQCERGRRRKEKKKCDQGDTGPPECSQRAEAEQKQRNAAQHRTSGGGEAASQHLTTVAQDRREGAHQGRSNVRRHTLRAH